MRPGFAALIAVILGSLPLLVLAADRGPGSLQGEGDPCGAALGNDRTLGWVSSEEEPFSLPSLIDGKYYTPRLCPHDESIYAVEVSSDQGNRLWLVHEAADEDRGSEAPRTRQVMAESEYSGQLTWCPAVWTPGEYWFAFVASGSMGNMDLYLASTSEASPVPLLSWRGVQFAPTWTPTGDALVFVSGGEEHGDLCLVDGLRAVMESRGRRSAAEPRLLVGGGPSDLDPAVSPDGRWLAFSRRSGGSQGGADLYVVPFSPSGAATLVPMPLSALDGEETHPSWSPDGRWLAYYYSEHVGSQQVDIGVARLLSSEEEGLPRLGTRRIVIPDVLSETFERPSWAPRFYSDYGNVRSLLFLRRCAGDVELRFVDLAATIEGGVLREARLATALLSLSGFDFANRTRGVVCGLESGEYRAYRVNLWGPSFSNRPFDDKRSTP